MDFKAFQSVYCVLPMSGCYRNGVRHSGDPAPDLRTVHQLVRAAHLLLPRLVKTRVHGLVCFNYISLHTHKYIYIYQVLHMDRKLNKAACLHGLNPKEVMARECVLLGG